MKQSTLSRIIISLVTVLFVAIVLIIGITCDVLSANYWINFSFMLLIAIGAFVFTFFYSIKNGTYLPFVAQYVKSFVIYVAFAAVVSLSLMFIKALLWFIPLLVHIISLIILFIYVATSSVGVSHVKSVHEKQMNEVQYLIMLETKLCEARDMCEDAENKSSYDKIIRLVQNSSYKSYPEATSIELELLNKADELIISGSQEQANILKQIHLLLNKRNNTISMARR